ncbi:Diadenosine 5',5'''-P1,P4-tetraphosphate phosphorylase 2 [Pseudocercospora fuligena]|uniref:Diadenosine 5',5'''-P1,P4-tetraphosphate phosphorylase 2 n=1 Tax=Pseudocercospora fuligena TaxID=685502 RepID=A0A8H6RWE0_9PEZI|nr:Diadenosine 5',5'''-P1,P4-tetraphosphate phosphorylase 2 [Pseudocercospora fuligena]
MTGSETTTEEPDLGARALEQFDRLVASGELLWKEVKPRHIEASPCNFIFYVAESLKSKPIDTEQKKTPRKEAFPESDGDWSLGIINGTHKLILNKFCSLRPQFVLPTLEFQPQSDPLNAQDLDALWKALWRLGGKKHFGIFNCGVEAGSSVGHKHMQVLPWVDSWKGIPGTKGEGLPFRAASSRIGESTSGKEILLRYDECRETLGMDDKQAHNVAMTVDEIIVIPRSKGWFEDGNSVTIYCNAAGMVGLVMCHSDEEYEAWCRYGPMQACAEFGQKACIDV